MITGWSRFNLYLLILVAGVVCSCTTTKEDRLYATVRVHVETYRDTPGFGGEASVYRANPVTIPIEKSPFLTEAEVESARVVEVPGGYMLQIQFEHRGASLLEQYTTTYPGKHYAIFCQFGEKLKQSRWVAAPVLHGRISNGSLIFTPDASREEADEIARGLTNIAKKIAAKSKW